VSVGVFGDRFLDIAAAYGARLDRLDFEWGGAAEPDALAQALEKGAPYSAVLLTHNETSTGVTNPLGELCQTIRRRSEALILVDAISSLGAIPLEADRWGIDCVVTGSQKAWGVPPGMAMVSVSERGWKAGERARMPRYYLDLERYRSGLKTGQFPWTPAIPILFGLAVALEKLNAEGREQVFSRHRRVAERAREGIRALGLELFADPSFASDTVTALQVPPALDGREIARRLREQYATIVGGGQERLSGRILRIGHLGWVQDADVDQALSALARVISDLR
jgi:aspartate aminotransferase-like enzyme